MGQHWYKQDGTACHTLVGANGKERDVTIKDARKLKLLPSVTGIIGQLDKPALTQWKLKQLMQAVHHCPVDEGHEDFDEIVWNKFKESTEQYSKDGTEIHNLLETFYKTGVIHDKEEFILPVLQLIQNTFPDYKNITSEYNFAHRDGFAGQIDLIIDDGTNKIIIDFKTKQGNQETLNKFKPYDSYAMQLAAYRSALTDVDMCINLFISVTDPGAIMVHIWNDGILDIAYKKFQHLLQFWILDKSYNPAFEETI